MKRYVLLISPLLLTSVLSREIPLLEKDELLQKNAIEKMIRDQQLLAPVVGNGSKEAHVNDISFYMWNRQTGPENYVEVELDWTSLTSNGYDPSNPTVILSHGFTGQGGVFGRPFARAYLQVGDFNVISINWERLARWYNYWGAADNTRFVGDHAANLVQILAENGGIERLHLVGHSLGAHVVGFIGKRVQELGLGKVPRITGLDPALPRFEFAETYERIDKEDADLVDIIHTNGGTLPEGGLAILKPIGHYDFYPAGGRHQPGCRNKCLVRCTQHDLNDLLRGGCSHSRAVEYYLESITHSTTSNFRGWQCDSWDDFQRVGECCQSQFAHMGRLLDRPSPEGSYYLMTDEESLFSLGERGNFC